MDVTICIATCDRPDGLERLLASIAELDRTPGLNLRVVVIDNHPDGTGAAIVQAWSTKLDVPIRYGREAQRGIPFARNAAIDEAGDADFIAFVDDDQTVDARWLSELIAVQARTGADIVTGPQLPVLPDEVPAWMRRSGAFDLLRFETGTVRPVAYTHNVLTRTGVFRDLWPPFDARFATSGGSDSHFYRRAHRAGYRIAWADEAITREWIPAGRATMGWLLRRSLRIGTTDAFIARDLDGWAVLPRTLLLAARYAGRGVVRALAAAWQGRAALVRSGQDLARALGLAGGACGLMCHEYRVRA
ncbi:MAG: glycosyltransferase family 2 protein [Planctomycetota bacterium]|jgi:glycosyltransferase involved in cell wall biosynthesis